MANIDSVISRIRQLAARPDSLRALVTVCSSDWSLSWRIDRLTVMFRFSQPRIFCQRAAWAQASRSTQAPMSTISPLSSASEMKRSGGIMPRSG